MSGELLTEIPATAATFEADKLTKADELLLIMIHF